jgi:hypothetical protein
MAIGRVHLRKLLKLFMMKQNLRSTSIRADAKDVMRKQEGMTEGGGDFHVPFWSDAKAHAAGRLELHLATAHQIDKNWRRKNLYPRLQDGFLLWWNEKRRWINEGISELPKTVKSTFGFADIGGVVKVENLLSLQIGDERFRYVYPDFSERPALTPEYAQLGLWLMSKALPEHRIEDMRILDVIRGEAYSIDKYPLSGNEEAVFTDRYRVILSEWRTYLE